jgi:transcriptional regulator with XRE-family HTH domain
MTGGPAGTASPFGVRLRRWRLHRGISQLALAGRVGSTPRHISLLETGRSRPSRQMVLRLGEVLDVALRERNELLAAAGLAGAYPRAPVTGPELAPYRAAIDRLLCTPTSRTRAWCSTVTGTYSSSTGRVPACSAGTWSATTWSGIFLANPDAAVAVLNWPEVAWAGLARLRQQADRAPLD